MHYTEFHIQELIRCREDIEYFADNYIKTTSGYGVVRIKLNDFQRQVIKNYKENKLFFMPAGRMEGKTTVASIILLHQALFTEYRVSIIFARTQAMSSHMLSVITEMYDRLPDFLACTKMTTRNKGKIEFDNLCSIISAGSNIDYGKGRALSNIYIDESEWFDKLDDIMTSLYPCMAGVPYAKLFSLSSTFTGDTFRKYNISEQLAAT